jgi:hypothetical protein|tara:strand:+ start:2290 stop:3141 length:852 start_codon:yes stop_codon:yes gene_type:complete
MKKHLLLLGVLLVLSCNSDDNATTSEPQAPVAENPEGILVVYKVLSNGNLEVVKDDYPTNTIVNESYQQDLDKHQEMWNLVKKIFPQYYLNSLSNLHIFSAVASENQYTAYVNFDDDRSKMTLGLAVDFAYFSLFDAQKYFTTTIIHELAHVISFHPNQYNSTPCDQPWGDENECLKEDAYSRLFASEFWTDLFDDYVNQDLDTFYNNNIAQFLNIYSAISPDEDFAEIFKQFIVIDPAPIGSTIPEKKIRFLYAIPALVDLRASLRDRLTEDGTLFLSSVVE